MKNFFYTFIPFFLFFLVQFLLLLYFKTEKQKVPLLIGKNWNDIPKDLHSNFFSFKILRIKSNKDYEHNYILKQCPSPGMYIKSNQPILLEINDNSISEENYLLKNTVQKRLFELISTYKKNGMHYKIIGNKNDNDNVLGIGMDKKGMHYFYCLRRESSYLIKNFLGLDCTKLKELGLSVVCYSRENIIINDCAGKVIKKQFPLPGITFDKIPHFFIWHED